AFPTRRSSDLSVDDEPWTVFAPQRTNQLPADGVVCVNAPVAEVTYQQRAARVAETLRRKRDSPRRVKRPVCREVAQQCPAGVEDVDEAVAAACNIVMGVGILLRVG